MDDSPSDSRHAGDAAVIHTTLLGTLSTPLEKGYVTIGVGLRYAVKMSSLSLVRRCRIPFKTLVWSKTTGVVRNHITLRSHSSANSTGALYCDLDAEPLERYRVGEYHPIHLGDTLGNWRYKVLQKLGWGGYATVWLARDVM